jgi:hypothetical protein
MTSYSPFTWNDSRSESVVSARCAAMTPAERLQIVGTLNARARALAWLSVRPGLSEEQHCYQYLHNLYGDELTEDFLHACSAGFYRANRSSLLSLRAHARPTGLMRPPDLPANRPFRTDP